ncbi:hypothetical protein [Maricaulis sp.]|uniref:hypothetical protein n=1 Tax=Maricaulis sp. TaxID=1486257 RepID=UPI003A93FAD6
MTKAVKLFGYLWVAIAATFLIAPLAIAGLLYWDAAQFRSPDFKSASGQILRETGLALTDPRSLLLARRTSSNLMGDHVACFLIALPEEEFDAFVARSPVSETRDDDTACPAGFEVVSSIREENFNVAYTTREPGGKMISVYADQEHHMVLVKMSYW